MHTCTVFSARCSLCGGEIRRNVQHRRCITCKSCYHKQCADSRVCDVSNSSNSGINNACTHISSCLVCNKEDFPHARITTDCNVYSQQNRRYAEYLNERFLQEKENQNTASSYFFDFGESYTLASDIKIEGLFDSGSLFSSLNINIP